MKLSPRLLSAALFACVLAAPAFAADTDFNYPAPVRTWNIEAGYRIPVENDTAETTYYRISYEGSLVDSRGTPLTAAQHFEITEPKIDDVIAGGDRSALELLLQKGDGALGGDLFEMNGAMPLALAGLDRLGLRGAAYVGADLDGDNVKAAAGLETRPFRLPGLGRREVSNWFVLGVMAERSEATDDDTRDSTYGLVTGRLFVGKAFGWRKSANPEHVAQAIETAILDRAPDLATAQGLAATISEKIKAADRTTLQQQLIDAAVETAGNDAAWRAKVRESARGAADALTDLPTFSVYLEATGWHAFSGQEGIPRHRGLVTLTTDYWPLASRDDVILRARYEWGFQRTTPDVRVNQFIVTLNLQL